MESEHKFMLNDILRKKRKSKMRKPECLVFLTYGPIHVSPLGWIKRWKEDIICICQRLRYGYCYRDAWAIDQWFLVIIPNMLNDLRINGHGYPGSFTGTEEENVRKWNRILEHMEFLFREANEEKPVQRRRLTLGKRWMSVEIAQLCVDRRERAGRFSGKEVGHGTKKLF